MRKRVGLFILVSLVYSLAWMSLALPYRPFPSDDDYFRSFIDQPGIFNSVLMTVRSHHPVLLGSLKLTKLAWFLFSNDLSSALLLQAVISNSVLLFLICLMVWALTKNVFALCAAAILYGTSAWPAAYYFFYSYAPFSAMLLCLGLYFILKAYIEPSQAARRLMWAGIVCGLAFWASPSAGVMIAAYFLILLYLFRCHSRVPLFGIPLRGKSGNPDKLDCPVKPDNDKVDQFVERLPEFSNIVRIYLKSLLLVILPFSFLSLPALKDHILENCRQYAGADVQVLKTPFFSFFRVLGEYNGWLLAGFLLMLVLYGIAVVLKRGPAPLQPEERCARALVIGVFLHSLLVDILPSTKLARTNFAVFPLFIIAAVSLFWFLFLKLSGRLKYCLAGLGIILLIPLLYTNLELCRQLIQSRQSLPAYLTAQPKDRPLYILEEDSHAEAIISWLEGFHIQRIKKADLERIVSAQTKGGIILGPSGPGSGQSILANCCLDDFLIEDVRMRLEKMNRVVLPYYAYFPPFLLEEETCEGLYFSGNIVDYRHDSKNITFFYW